MPITADEAADIAARHGLGLNDAAGLLSLAENLEDADRIASRFASVNDENANRRFLRSLFGDRAEATTAPTPPAKHTGTTNPDDRRTALLGLRDQLLGTNGDDAA